MNAGWKFACLVSVQVALAGPATASTFRPIPLSRLLQKSPVVVVATPVSHNAHWAVIGSTRRVVTDSTLEVAWSLRGEDCAGKDIVVRTLGGTVGGVGQIVYGEARLTLGQSSVLFLVPGQDGVYSVMGMAQGQYPLEPADAGDWTLKPSLGLDGVLDSQRSAVATLNGRRLSDIPALIAKELAQ
jgi:hypothetical protein